MNTPRFFSKLSINACLALSIPLLMIGCGGDNSGLSTNGQNPYGDGPASVSLSKDGAFKSAPGDLGSAGSYVIMAETTITNVTGSSITGNMGISPNNVSSISGFTLTPDASNQFSTAPNIVGRVYGSTYAVPTPSNLTTANGSMKISYEDAAGRTDPDHTELATGNLAGLTLAPGLYKWSNTVILPGTVTLSGSSTDVWIFQISGDLVMDPGMAVVLSGGAKAKNIFWQVAGQATFGSNSHFEGILLCKTSVTLQTNASMNGRIYAQAQVAMDDNVIVQPAN